MDCFKACMRSQVRPLWMVVGKVYEGFEPELFKLKFKEWYQLPMLHKVPLIETINYRTSPALYKTCKDVVTPVVQSYNIILLECYRVLHDLSVIKCKQGSNGWLNTNHQYVFVIVFTDTTEDIHIQLYYCLLYTSPSPRDGLLSRMPSSA